MLRPGESAPSAQEDDELDLESVAGSQRRGSSARAGTVVSGFGGGASLALGHDQPAGGDITTSSLIANPDNTDSLAELLAARAKDERACCGLSRGVGILLCLGLLLCLSLVAWRFNVAPVPVARFFEGLEALAGVGPLAGLSAEQRLPHKQSYRILLLGDSLTTGYNFADPDALTPYRAEVERLLNEKHPEASFIIDSEAVSGECVVKRCVDKSLQERLFDRLRTVDEQGRPMFYDLSVVLAGTNDLFHDFPSAQISVALSTLHWTLWTQQPAPELQPASPKTLALTIPQFGDGESWRPEHRPSQRDAAQVMEARTELNEHLRELCNARPLQCFLVDLDEAMPRWSLSEEDRARYWGDDVHPSAEGYTRMGRVIYNQIDRILPAKKNKK